MKSSSSGTYSTTSQRSLKMTLFFRLVPLSRGPCSRRETKDDLAGEGPVLGDGVWSLSVNPGSGNRDVEGAGIRGSEVEGTGDGVRDSEVVDC